jgi:plasmid maintenance system killer protein
MTRLRIDPGFEGRLAKLDVTLRRRAVRALERFIETPARAGANFERIEGTHGKYWSLRATRNFRIILRHERDVAGDVYVAIDVGPHDIYRRYSGRR